MYFISDFIFELDQRYCTMLQTTDIRQFYRLAGIWINWQMAEIGKSFMRANQAIFPAMNISNPW